MKDRGHSNLINILKANSDAGPINTTTFCRSPSRSRVSLTEAIVGSLVVL